MTSVGEPTRVAILGRQLRAAREAIGLSLEEAAEAANVQPRQLAEWESDEAEPGVEQLSDLAELYCRGMDYFLRATPPPPMDVSFRIARARSMHDLSLDARKLLARFEELCRGQTELEQLLQRPAGPALPEVSAPLGPEALAARERERLALGEGPIANLRRVLETQGLRIFELLVPDTEFAGFSWRHPGYGPCVLVNAGDVAGRRTWTLAHEYFHLLISEVPHICDLQSLGSPEERRAERFAASLLMPREGFLRDWRKRGGRAHPLGWEHIRPLARRYHVSLQAAAIRLAELGAVAAHETDSLLEREAPAAAAYGRAKPRYQRQLGERYIGLALNAYSRGRISLGKLADYLDMAPQRALEIAEARMANGST